MGKGMRAGKRPKAPKQHRGANMQAQLTQVQQMQKMMEAAQSEIDKMETTATARGGAAVDAPVLCKDFVVDPVQVLAARSLGADAILLMLSVVPDDVYRELADLAAELGMEVLTSWPPRSLRRRPCRSPE